MKRRIGLLAWLAWLIAASASAQTSLPGLRPPDAIDQARGRALQPVPKLETPAAPTERWVPQRRVFLPEIGREVVVPGHYERRISDQQVTVPTLPVYPTDRQGGTIYVPGGERPPADLRQGP